MLKYCQFYMSHSFLKFACFFCFLKILMYKGHCKKSIYQMLPGFLIPGMNAVGPGQEMILTYLTPEGVPTDSPKNISWRFQTPDVVEIVYDSPPEPSRNGQIILYEIQFWKGADPNQKKVRSTTSRKAVFANLDDNTEYKFSVRANTRKGYGPWSTQQTFRTDRNIVRAPLGLKAMATSESSLEVR
jgi:netrin-G3 ligand